MIEHRPIQISEIPEDDKRAVAEFVNLVCLRIDKQMKSGGKSKIEKDINNLWNDALRCAKDEVFAEKRKFSSLLDERRKEQSNGSSK